MLKLLMKLYADMTPKNTALVVIDPVNSCADERCETPEWKISFNKIREMLPKLELFLQRYRREIGGLVVIANLTPWTKENLPENVNELYTDPDAIYYSDNTDGFDEKFYAVKPESTDLIFTKNSYSVFADGKLLADLKTRGIKYVIMTGVFTDGCVLASIVDGFSHGLNFVILKDLIETTDVPERQELQKLLIKFTFPRLYGKAITSEELLEELK